MKKKMLLLFDVLVVFFTGCGKKEVQQEKVGVDEFGKPQGSECAGWFNAELIGRSKVLRKTNINQLR